MAQAGLWTLVPGIILVATTLRAPITAVGPLTDTLRSATSLSHTLLGMLTTLPLLAFALISPLAPKLGRRLGMERTMFLALILLLFGILIRSLPSTIFLFLGTAMLGAAIAVNNVLLPSLIKREFTTQVGTMTGLYSFSMNLFAALSSGLSIPLSTTLGLGWRGALGIWAILAVLAMIAWIPQQRGQQHKAQVAATQPASTSSLWKSPLAWTITLLMGFQSVTFYVGIAWIPEILQQRGLSASSAGWMLSLMQFVSLPGSFLIPVIAGRMKSQRSISTGVAILYIIGYTGLLLSGSSWLALWMILIGVAGGCSFSLVIILFSLRTRTTEQAAELSGMAQSFGYLLAAAGPPLFGLIHDMTGSWTAPLILLVVISCIILLCGLSAGRNRVIS
nr:MFS transporter [Paenibacillus shirakamiensis]